MPLFFRTAGSKIDHTACPVSACVKPMRPATRTAVRIASVVVSDAVVAVADPVVSDAVVAVVVPDPVVAVVVPDHVVAVVVPDPVVPIVAFILKTGNVARARDALQNVEPVSGGGRRG